MRKLKELKEKPGTKAEASPSICGTVVIAPLSKADLRCVTRLAPL